MMVEKGAFDQGKGKERCVLVGLQMDANGNELLNWAMSRVAEQGDRVMAVHVCRDSDLKNTTTLSLIRKLDGYLAAYDGFCELKQVALVGRVSRGNSIRKVMVKEAKLCDAMKVVVGVTQHCALGGSASLAKYCAKKLPPTTAVIAIQGGKIVFEREVAKPSQGEKPRTLHPSTVVKHKAISPSSSENGGVGTTVPAQKMAEASLGWPLLGRGGPRHLETSREEEEASLGWPLLGRGVPKHLEASREEEEANLGWPLLGRGVPKHLEAPREEDSRKMSVVQWAMNLPNRSLSFTTLQLDLVQELKTILGNTNSNCRWFQYDELRSSTDQFCSGNVIGKGGSSQVYRGCLPNGRHVAIKSSKLSEEASRDFLSEVNIITKLDHKLIVPLIGVCVEDNTLLSVYNYFPTGSLEENLHGKDANSALPWDRRYKVATGVAEALSYLHNGCSNPVVIHRDVKSSNILLTDEFEPQLSDFGLAIWAPTTSTCLTHDDVVGTFGYLAPEYFMYGKVSDKIDVFAFGVVLLELLTGRRSISDDNPKGQESLVMWATPILERGDFMELLDPNVKEKYDEVQMRRIAFAASLCTTRRARFRPRMREILSLLQGEEEIEAWIGCHINATSNRLDCQDDEAYPSSSVGSHIGMALLAVDEDDDASLISFDHSNLGSLEEYLRGRWSRSSSFD